MILTLKYVGTKRTLRKNRCHKYMKKYFDEFTPDEIAKDKDKNCSALTETTHQKFSENVIETYFVEEEPSDNEEEEEDILSSDGQNERIVDGICDPEDASSMSDDSCHGNINEGIENGDNKDDECSDNSNDDEYNGAGAKALFNMRDGNVVPELM